EQWVVLRPGGESLFVDLRREQLGERGAHRFRPGRTACEIHIGIDREAHPRQQLLQALHLSTRQAHRLREPQPRLDPAGILAVAVVIENALYPVAPHATVVAIGEDGGVLDGNADLVIEAVRHPAANLRRRGLAGIQHHVEWMVDVVGAAALTQLLLEFRGIPGRGRHSSISSPSHATSIPRRVSSACSGELSSSIGLLLFTWIRILRVPAGSFSSHSSIPPEPLCGRCPISRARLRDSPSRIISSSLQKVPSTSTQAAARMARHSCGSMAARPGAYTAVLPVCSSPITSATLSPATGDSRLGE